MTVNQRKFFRTLTIVAVVHVVCVLLFGLASFIPNPFEQKAEAMIPIEFVVDTSVLDEPKETVSEDTVPEPEQEAETVPEITEPEVKKPDPPKPDKQKIERSQKRVVRSPDTPSKPVLTPEEVKRRLAMGAVAGDHNSPLPSDGARDLGLIHAAFYDVWQQPSAASVGNATVVAAIRLDAGGQIVSRRLTRRSGIAELDDSVQRALDAVTRIPGLSPRFLERQKEVTIEFDVQ